MKLFISTLVALAVGIVPLALANPMPPGGVPPGRPIPIDPAPNTISAFYVCTAIDYKQSCQWVQVSKIPSECVNFTDPYLRTISSAKPSPNFLEPVDCTFYSEPNCPNNSKQFMIDGAISDLRKWNYNDMAASIKCYQRDTSPPGPIT